MNNKSQIFTITTILIISVLVLISMGIYNDSLDFNQKVQDSIISSEISYQDYNFWHVLSQALKVRFTRLFGEDHVNVTMSAGLYKDMNPYNNLTTYNDFLNTYESFLGVSMNYSMNDLINSVNNGEYVRDIESNNVSVITSYENNNITYTNNSEINYYFFDLIFNGQISNIEWNPNPVGNDIPVIIKGPQTREEYVMDENTDYELYINASLGAVDDSIHVSFDNTNKDETIISYSEIDDIGSCEREPCGGSSTGKYDVEIKNNDETIKFDGTGHLMGEDRVCESEKFIMEVNNATNIVTVTTKAGPEDSHVFSSPGETWYDALGFKIHFIKIDGDEYYFEISSVCNNRAINTITFDFSSGSTVISPTNKYETNRTCCEEEEYEQVYDGIDLSVTTMLDFYGNNFKISSPYPNTMVNFSFNEFFVSRGFE